MKKLLSANCARLKRSKSLWCYVIAMYLITVWYICVGAKKLGIYTVDVDAMDFSTFIVGMVPAFLTLFTGFFVGTEYSDKTIRNKLSVGHTRKDVYLSYLFTLYTAIGIFFAAWILGTITAFGVMGEELDIIRFLRIFLVAIFFSAAFVSLLLLISIAFQSKALAVILEIEYARISIMIPFMGSVLMESMDGIDSKMIIFFINCFPMGQWVASTKLLPVTSIAVPAQIIISGLLMTCIAMFGIHIFKNKELK